MTWVACRCVGIFHSHDQNATHYPPLIWPHTDSDAPLVQPEWLALLFFSLASSDSARIVSAPTVTSNPFIKAWATVTPDDEVRVAILHKDLNATGNASVALDLSLSLSDFPTAYVVRVTAPSPYASYGLDFAGLSWDGTVDGRPRGQPHVEQLEASQSGVYNLTVSPISLVLVSIPPAGRGGLEKLIRFEYHTESGKAARQHRHRAMEEVKGGER